MVTTLVSGATVASISGSLPVLLRDHEDWRGVLAVSWGSLEVESVVLDGKFLLKGRIVAFLVLEGYSGETLYQRPFILLGSLDPVDYSWDDRVLRLRFDPVEVS